MYIPSGFIISDKVQLRPNSLFNYEVENEWQAQSSAHIGTELKTHPTPSPPSPVPRRLMLAPYRSEGGWGAQPDEGPRRSSRVRQSQKMPMCTKQPSTAAVQFHTGKNCVGLFVQVTYR